MRQLTVCLMLLAVGSLAVSAEEFYLRYDANDFPENEGWERQFSDPGGQIEREIDSGIFRLDTRASTSLYDFYAIQSPTFDLLPGEELRVSWRMETVDTQTTYGLSDVAVGITNSTSAFTKFYLAPDFVSEDEELGGDPEHVYAFDQGVPHSFLFVTSDMQEYDLFVDGVFAFHGALHGNALIGPLHVWFGDTTVGRSSLSRWGWIEIAVVPEPHAGLLLVVGGVAGLAWWTRLDGASRRTLPEELAGQ